MTAEVTPQDRFRTLMHLNDKLKRSVHHTERGGHIISRKLPQLKAQIFAQVYGIISAQEDNPDVHRRAFRWLLAHTAENSVSYDMRKSEEQWPHIMEYYFRRLNGHYAEVALLERILLSVYKKQSPHPIGDILIADRLADYHMMTDWLMHLPMVHGTMQLGIQLAAGRGNLGKINDLHKRKLNDKPFLKRGDVPQAVRDLLRHNTAILTFPRFKTAQENRETALRFLRSGSSRYQSEMIATTGNKTFNDYGRQVLRILQFFHEGITDRVIDYRARLQHHEFSKTDERGETVSGSIYDHQGMPIASIRIQDPPHNTSPKSFKPKIRRNKPVIFSVPIFPDFLDLYRDMAGVQAK